jgi:hypothetical protein
MHYKNVFARTPNVKYIFSHAGGTTPFLAKRLSIIDEMNVMPGAEERGTAADTFRRLYWDTALSWSPASAASRGWARCSSDPTTRTFAAISP